MSVNDDFTFDNIFDEGDEDFSLYEENSSTVETDSDSSATKGKRTSADFHPDMDALLLTAQSSMIVEAMNLFSNSDFKQSSAGCYSEAINGLNLFIKLLERNPGHFKKLSSELAYDHDFAEVINICYRHFENVSGEFPESDSQKIKAFEMVREMVNRGYLKSLISRSIIDIKEFFLLSGGLDYAKFDKINSLEADSFKKKILILMKYIKISIQFVKSGDVIINPALKGRDLNNYIVNTTELLSYYFSIMGQEKYSLYYRRLYENYKKYFIVR